MPTIPSPMALLPLLSVKLGGYGVAGAVLRRVADGRTDAAPFVFALSKTALGFVSGLAYSTGMLQLGVVSASALYIAFLPVRLFAWMVTVTACYRFARASPSLLIIAAAGVVWSCVLDLIAWAFIGLLPGMTMPFC